MIEYDVLVAERIKFNGEIEKLRRQIHLNNKSRKNDSEMLKKMEILMAKLDTLNIQILSFNIKP